MTAKHSTTAGEEVATPDTSSVEESTAIATVTASKFAAIFPIVSKTPSDMAEILEPTLQGGGLSPLSLPTITIPIGGGTKFTIPTARTEDSPLVEKFEAIYLFHHVFRTFWVKGFDGTASQPDCSSQDGKFGTGMYGIGSQLHPYGSCSDCPMAVFGSKAGGGKGQACGKKLAVYLVLPGIYLPVKLILPPTGTKSAKADPTGLDGFLNACTLRGRKASGLVIEVGLRQEPFGGPRSSSQFSLATFREVGELSLIEASRVRGYAEGLRQFLMPARDTEATSDEPQPVRAF